MKRDCLKVFAISTVSAFLASSATAPAQAHCHHHHSSMHCHSHFQHHYHHSYSHFHSTSQHYTAAADENPSPEKAAQMVDLKVKKLDNQLTEKLNRITQLQDLQFKDQANSAKYDELIAGEREQVDQIEANLATELEKQKELRQRVELKAVAPLE